MLHLAEPTSNPEKVRLERIADLTDPATIRYLEPAPAPTSAQTHPSRTPICSR